eukprot:1141837-Pelagomonas_calceolata.AAC.3
MGDINARAAAAAHRKSTGRCSSACAQEAQADLSRRAQAGLLTTGIGASIMASPSSWRCAKGWARGRTKKQLGTCNTMDSKYEPKDSKPSVTAQAPCAQSACFTKSFSLHGAEKKKPAAAG